MSIVLDPESVELRDYLEKDDKYKTIYLNPHIQN